MPRLTQTRAERLPLPTTDKRNILRCDEVKGFGVIASKGGTRSWFVESSRLRRTVLGDIVLLHCEDTPDGPGARGQAIAMLAAARNGKDPALARTKKVSPNGVSLNAIWKHYEGAGYPMLRGTGLKEPRTITEDKNRWAKYVDKSIGKKLVSELDEKAILRWLDTIPTEGQRSHCLTLVKSILKWGGSRGHCTPHTIYATASRSKWLQNFYTDEESIRIIDALDGLIAESPHRIFVWAAILLLIHSGARSGSEIFSAEWRRFDAKGAVLYVPQPKEDKPKDILLSPEAVALLEALPRINRWIFPSDSKSGHLTTVQNSWTEVCERAGVPRYRPHDIRHTFISRAIKRGVSLFTAGQLVGHRQASTTQRYAHLEHDTKRAALDKTAAAIAKPVTSNEKGQSVA